MKRYKIRCRFCIFFRLVDGRSYCDLYKCPKFEVLHVKKGWKQNEDKNHYRIFLPRKNRASH